MQTHTKHALERIYAAAIADDRSTLVALLGPAAWSEAEADEPVCTGFAGTLRFLRFVAGRFTPCVTLENIEERGATVEVRGRLNLRGGFDEAAFEIPFVHQHAFGRPAA